MTFFRNLIISLLFCSTAYFSQTYLITGKISSANDDSPLSYGNIRSINSSFGTSSNIEGYFQLNLPPGKHTLCASYIGFISDTLDITLKSNLEHINFKLRPAPIELPEATIFPRENPANEIIKRVIMRKQIRNASLNNYEYEAYTKGLIRTANELKSGDNSLSVQPGASDSIILKITGILENSSKGFFKKPNKRKEFITARKQTANFPPTINLLTGGVLIQDFYSEEIHFFGTSLPGPISNNALSYYYYMIEDSLAIDNKLIYKLKIEPDNSSDPGFIGNIYIADKDFNILKIDVALNRAANIGGIFDKIGIIQQFAQYGDSIYMPIDYRLFIEGNPFGLLKFEFEFNSVIINYNINSNFSNDIFSMAVLTVAHDADKKDSSFWKSTESIPNTLEEAEAYRRIDSIESLPSSLWDRFDLLSNRLAVTNSFEISTPLGMYHFNRIEGNSLDFGLYFSGLFDKRLNATSEFSYGFSDKRFKKSARAKYYFGDYRQFNAEFSAFDRLNVLFEESDNYNDFTSSILALFTKYEYRDYYYAKGFKAAIEGELFPILKLGVGFSNQTDKTAYKCSDFSFFYRNKNYSENQSINDIKVNSLEIAFTLDFRNYIEDGYFRRRLGYKNFIPIISGKVVRSDSKYFSSEADFWIYSAQATGQFKTFKSARLEYFLFGLYSNDFIPTQSLYALPGNLSSIGKNFTFRTARINEFYGNKAAAVYFEHNFRDEIFRVLRIPLLRDSEIYLNSFFNAAYLETSKKTQESLKMPYKSLANPLMELGFGLSHPLFPIKIEFAWRLNHKERNKFTIALNSLVF